MNKVDGNKFAPSTEELPNVDIGALDNSLVSQRQQKYLEAANDPNVVGAYPVVFAPEEK